VGLYLDNYVTKISEFRQDRTNVMYLEEARKQQGSLDLINEYIL